MFFKSQLGKQGYYPEDSPRTSANLLFGMYHHSTLDNQKSIILNSFHKEKGAVRLVFATNALGIELYHAMLKQKIWPPHLSSSAMLDEQKQSFLLSWDSKWPLCDKGLWQSISLL